MNVLENMGKHKIVAIVRLDDLSTARHITEALVEGGIRAIEFTLTNSDAVPTIAAMRKSVDERVAIGAGSVTTSDQVRAVADAGAQFVVSPVSKRDVITACAERNLPAMPGAFTPTEIQQAWEWGASVVKVFPA
ncbi:MAG: bifunctional 4-hydroxy-2-oxoglutarate aldolase/2-dehydro-3-deoxy-phosphogluconate aldolase, partial [Chloroflexi bacterium]|nr:bifunctional 4-hydroxy-2-oxoglutarate aldolase/2-dehydro-3-deoxy-phosphogluconate aldolase [Chloroflexota bacterium]